MRVLLKRSATAGVVPAANLLEKGELAINIADGKLFTLDSNNNVIELNGGSGGGAVDSVNGKTGIVVLNTDDIENGLNNQWLTEQSLMEYFDFNQNIKDKIFDLIQYKLENSLDGSMYVSLQQLENNITLEYGAGFQTLTNAIVNVSNESTLNLFTQNLTAMDDSNPLKDIIKNYIQFEVNRHFFKGTYTVDGEVF